MPHAIIVAHGQPSDPGPQQAAIESLAARVAAAAPNWTVRGATLAAPGALDAAVAEAGPDAVIYPMFMAAGWFTGRELPRRLAQTGAEGARILTPFGLDPGLPDLCRTKVGQACAAAGWAPEDTTLLLAAHGSQRARGSAEGAAAMAARLAPHFARVVTGFVEEDPFIADAAQGLGPRVVCLPFFATNADHVRDDIPRALDQAGFTGARLDPIGLAPEVPAMIAAALARGEGG